MAPPRTRRRRVVRRPFLDRRLATLEPLVLNTLLPRANGFKRYAPLLVDGALEWGAGGYGLGAAPGGRKGADGADGADGAAVAAVEVAV